ncbi:peptide-methionine (S)-S-oxide reductase MsrA [Maribacter sp.]|uniref:peptide-methionine (S)-S-oxide reductase MsrA n=1 Tax=Maribacter sp. TaxID=1897614 RepID=UPI0025B99216|nr:peptide-methionine (S)-S-oxide reductase MsrA [Maribacter sp.]
MSSIKFLLLATSFLFTVGCQSKIKKEIPVTPEVEEVVTLKLTPQELSAYETAYFASGCFWCVEAIFESVKGVKEVVSGYSGGKEKNPTYEDVGYGRTTHAEAVKVYYDPKVISFTALVQVFFGSHDPTTLNRQGPDKGAQYRSVAFYKNDSEKNIITNYIKALKDQGAYKGKKITTQVTPFIQFYKAEEYHQDYEKRNPNNSYIQNVSIPRLNRFKKNFGDFLKEDMH